MHIWSLTSMLLRYLKIECVDGPSMENLKVTLGVLDLHIRPYTNYTWFHWTISSICLSGLVSSLESFLIMKLAHFHCKYMLMQDVLEQRCYVPCTPSQEHWNHLRLYYIYLLFLYEIIIECTYFQWLGNSHKIKRGHSRHSRSDRIGTRRRHGQLILRS